MLLFARALIGLTLALSLLLPLRAGAEQVTLFAASSLKTALDEIAPAFEAATGHEMTVSLAGSSVLARQIEYGAPADVFISANAAWMDVLDGQGLLVAGSRVDLLGNRLALIGTQSGAATLDDLLADQSRIAMALVDAVPAGIYGQEAFQQLGVWDQIQPRVVQTDNVRAALALVALGEAPWGVVYATDAQAEPKVFERFVFPAGSHPAITYPAARLTDGPGARDLLQFLRGPEAAGIFAAHGFDVAGAGQ